LIVYSKQEIKKDYSFYCCEIYNIENEYLYLILTMRQNTLFVDCEHFTHLSTLTYHQQITK